LSGAALGRKIAAHHFAAFRIHDLRIGRGLAGDREKALRIKSHALGEHETFGKCQTIEAEDEIDRELATTPLAAIPHVKLRWRIAFTIIAALPQFLGVASG